MRIGLVTPSWPGTLTANGITTAVAYLAQGLRAAGHEVTIIAMTIDVPVDDPSVIAVPAPARGSLLDRLKARIDPETALHASIAHRISAAVHQAIKARNIEILVMEETEGWAGMVQEMVPIPIVVTLHGPWFIHKGLQSFGTTISDQKREAREAHAFQVCAGITAPSSDVLVSTQKAHDLPPTPQAMIPNPMPVLDPVDHAGLSEIARKTLLFVGRYDRHKGGDVLLEAFRLLIEGGADGRLTFIGPDKGVAGPDGSTEHLSTALTALPEAVRSRIDYRGECSKTDIDRMRPQHSIAVIASRYENLNYTLLEALATGMATVSTAVGGPAEVLSDGETGLLVPSENPAALAEALARLISDPNLAARLGTAARADLAKRCDPERIAQDMVGFLDKVLAR